MNYQQLFLTFQITNMPNTSETSFAEMWAKEKDKIFFRQKKFTRNKAAKRIGFSNQKGAFTKFLRINYLICQDNIPNSYLMDNHLMASAIKTLDNRSHKIINTPLFTEKGIDYLKKMMNEPDFLISENNILKANLTYSSYLNCS